MGCPLNDHEAVTAIDGVGAKLRDAWAKHGVVNVKQLRRAIEEGRELPRLTKNLREKIEARFRQSDADTETTGFVQPAEPPIVPPRNGGGPPNVDGPEPEGVFEAMVAQYYGKGALEKLRHNPEIRLLSSKSRAVRETFLRLYTSNFKFDENYLGRATPTSVEAQVKGWEAQGEAAMAKVENHYIEYVLGLESGSNITMRERLRASAANVSAEVGGPRMSRIDFFGHVTNTMESKGRAPDSVPKPARRAVEQSAKVMRQEFYLPILERRKELGFEQDTDAEAFVPRDWDAQKIADDPDGFEKVIREAMQDQVRRSDLPDDVKARVFDEIDQAVPKWREVVERTPYTRMPEDFPEFMRDANRASRQRKLGEIEFEGVSFKMPDHIGAEYRNRNIADITHRYLRTQVVDMELKAEFGSIDLMGVVKRNPVPEGKEPTPTQIELDYQPLIDAAPDTKTRQALVARMNEDIEDLENLVAVMRGTYAVPANPHSMQGRLQRGAKQMRNWTFMRVGGGFGITSISDASAIAMEEGVTRTMGAYVRELRDGLDVIARQHSDKDFSELHIAFTDLLHRRSMNMADIDGLGQSITRAERIGDVAASRMATISGLRPWTNFSKYVGARLVTDRIAKFSTKIANGTATPEEIARLGAAFISSDEAAQIAALFKRHGGSEDGYTWLGVEEWGLEDQALAKKVRNAILRDVDRVVVTPGAADVPTLMHSWEGQTILQFRRFGVAHTNRMGVPALQGLKAGDQSMLGGAAMSVALGSTVYMLKEITNKREVPTDISRIIQEGLVRSDLWGVLGEVDGLTSATTGGLVSARGFIGPDTYYGGRFGNDLAGTLLGPNLDTGEEGGRAVRALFPFSDSSARDIRALRKALPLQNLFYFDWLLDAYENGLVESHTAAREARRIARQRELIE